MRLDKLESSLFGIQTPDDFIIDLCHELIRKKNPKENANYKTFTIEIEINDLKHESNLDSVESLHIFKKKKEEELRKQEKSNGTINPSRRRNIG